LRNTGAIERFLALTPRSDASSGQKTQEVNQVHGWEVLMDAASTGNIPLLDILLEQGIVVDTIAEDGYTAMHCAARSGQVAMIRHLLSKGANIDAANLKVKGRRPIQEAIIAQHVGAVAALVHAGAGLLLKDMNGRTIFDLVAQVMHLELAQALFQADQEKKHTHEMASLLITSSVKAGNASLLRWLLSTFPQALPQPKNLHETPVYMATRRGHHEILEILLTISNSANHSNKEFMRSVSYSLPQAARIGSSDMVKLLIGCKNINVNQGDTLSRRTTLHHAAGNGNVQVTKILLGHKDINVNSMSMYNNTPLHEAAMQGHSEVVEVILAHAGVNFQWENLGIMTPLNLAFSHCRWKVLQIIAQHHGIILGFNVESTTEELPTTHVDQFLAMTNDLLDRGLLSKVRLKWSSIANMAVVSGTVEIVRFLLHDLNFDVNASIGGGSFITMLHLAAQHHRYDILRLCLEHPRIEINQRASWVRHSGETVLHFAVRFDNIVALKLLLARPEIDVTLHNRDGETALELATKLQRHEMVQLLLQHTPTTISSETEVATGMTETGPQLDCMSNEQEQ
jgi:ankyrin repeat protein